MQEQRKIKAELAKERAKFLKMQEKARREANKKKNAIKVSKDEPKEEKAKEEKTQKQETKKEETQQPKKEAAKIRKQKQRKTEKERKKEREKRIKQETEARRTYNKKVSDIKSGAEVPLNKLPYLPYERIKKIAQFSGSRTQWMKNNVQATGGAGGQDGVDLKYYKMFEDGVLEDGTIQSTAHYLENALFDKTAGDFKGLKTFKDIDGKDFVYIRQNDIFVYTDYIEKAEDKIKEEVKKEVKEEAVKLLKEVVGDLI